MTARPRPLVVQAFVCRYAPVHQILAPDVELDRESVKRLFKDYYKIMSLPPRRVKSMSQLSGRITSVALALLLLVAAVIAKAADPPACKVVRISDIGWTDVTSTSALFSALVRELGYDSQVTVLSVPVTYASMKNKDIDVFLGNWIADHGRRPQGLLRRSFNRRHWRQSDGRQVHARRSLLHLRGRTARLRGHPALRTTTEERHLWHRAGQTTATGWCWA